MTTYEYVIASAVPAGKVYVGALSNAIEASSSITKALLSVTVDSGKCYVAFAEALDAAEKTALDALVAAHPGYGFAVKYHTSSTILPTEAEVAADADWDLIGEVFTNPEFFLGPNLAGGKGRVVCQVKSVGSGAQLRLVESNGTDVIVATYDVPDSSGAWVAAKFFTTVASRSGDQRYRLEGRRNGATSLAVRAASISLLEFIVVQGQS